VIKPVVERAADKWAKAVNVVKYDVEHENVSDLKAKLDEMGVKISSLPTLILLKDGEYVSSRSGVVTDMDVNTFLSRNLHKARTSCGAGQ
jgi:thioredoxin-like negative regulator of GroEL